MEAEGQALKHFNIIFASKPSQKMNGGKVPFWHTTCEFCFHYIDQWNLVTVKMWEIKNNMLSSENNV